MLHVASSSHFEVRPWRNMHNTQFPFPPLITNFFQNFVLPSLQFLIFTLVAGGEPGLQTFSQCRGVVQLDQNHSKERVSRNFHLAEEFDLLIQNFRWNRNAFVQTRLLQRCRRSMRRVTREGCEGGPTELTSHRTVFESVLHLLLEGYPWKYYEHLKERETTHSCNGK